MAEPKNADTPIIPKLESRCFISYRHSDNTEPGREWVSWLHHSLETYEGAPETSWHPWCSVGRAAEAGRGLSAGEEPQTRSRLWLAAVGVFAIAAIVGGWQAMQQADHAQSQKMKAYKQAGEGWILRAEVAVRDHKDVESAFYAARAVGFEGFGKASPTAQLESRSGNEGAKFFRNGTPWDMGDFFKPPFKIEPRCDPSKG